MNNTTTTDTIRASRALADIRAALGSIKRAMEHLSDATDVYVLSISPHLDDAMLALELAEADAASEVIRDEEDAS